MGTAVIVKNQIIANFSYGEVSPRQAHGVLYDTQLQMSLREAHNVLISRNLEVTNRPPLYDQGAMPVTGTTKSYAFRLPSGDFTIIIFSALKITQFVVGSEDTFSAITTTWTAADVAVMDGAQYENDAIFVTPGKEPMHFLYTPGTNAYTWTKLEDDNTGSNPTPWFTASDWPKSVSFMIGRFIMLSTRKYYGSTAGDVLNWDLVMRTVEDESVVKASSAFSFDAADDLDAGFSWIKGGTLAFAGSPAGVWMMSNYEDGLNATNPNIKNYSSIGTYNVKAVDADGAMVYFANDGVTVKAFNITPQGPNHMEVNPYAKHLFEDHKPVKMVFQRTPDSVIWILRDDGKLVSFQIDQRRKAWAFHETSGTIKDIWLCKSNTTEYLYMDIDRGTRRIERFGDVDPLAIDYFLDGQINVASPTEQDVESVTAGISGEGIFTITAHGYSDGDTVRTPGIDNAWGSIVLLTANTFNIQTESKALVPASVGSDFKVVAAVWDKTYSFLANKTMDVYLDEYFVTIKADATGKLSFPVPASKITIGYEYEYYIQPKSFVDVHGPSKAAVTKIQPRMYKAKMISYGKTGLESDKHLIPIENEAYSGTVQDIIIPGGADHECTFYLGADHSPFILLSCFVNIEVEAV